MSAKDWGYLAFVISACCAMLVIAALAACAPLSSFNQEVVDPLITVLDKVNATAVTDLQGAEKAAQAATPTDTDGFNCAAAAIVVLGEVTAEFAVVSGAKSAPGPLTLAEMASLFQPGSAQYNAAKQTLTSGCAAKAQDVLGAAGVLAAGGVIGALATQNVLPLAAAIP